MPPTCPRTRPGWELGRTRGGGARRGRRLRHVAGRIRDDDIAEVREKARIDDVVSSYVTLKHAGGGSLKGLCPFHDEKSPSFHVNASRGFFHCFGCQEGGDVISFLMKIDGLSFAEAVERLADKYGVRAAARGRRRRRAPAGPRPRPADRGQQDRPGVLRRAARHRPTPCVARQFLGQRGFDQASAETFGVGFAPRDGEALLRHLRGRRFTDEELVAAGLVEQGRSAYDAFRGRLLWPIRDASGDTIGFGARRIFDDDRIEAKYLNTADSPIYKKSHVLYGIDLARREMARSSQAVVVEGYTDVMACHLAGVPTAVATCGTAFGDDHARVLRRFLHDHEEFRGEVIFTFDGDAAGQKAALRAFGGDQNFVSQTYVAVEPDGLDPCDLRIQKGDAAVRELVATREPLYRFVLGNVADQVRPRPRRRPGRRAARGGRPGLEHPRQVQGRRLRPRDRRDDRRRRRRGPRGGTPRGQPARARPPPAATIAARTTAVRRPSRSRPAPQRPQLPEPARPAVLDRARDAQDRDPAPGLRRARDQRRRPRRLHPPDLPRRCGRRSRRPAARRPAPRTRAGAPGCGRR